MCASNTSKFAAENIQMRHLKAFICRNSSIDLVRLSYDNIIYSDIQNIKLSDDDMKQILVKAPKLLHLKATNTSRAEIIVDEKVNMGVVVLNLAFNNIRVVRRHNFKSFQYIATLILHSNQVHMIESKAFAGLSALQSMDLSGNPLQAVFLSGLQVMSPALSHVWSDLLSVCCLLPHVDHCQPETTEYSSCQNLLHHLHHQVIMFFQAVVTFVANLAVIAVRQRLFSEERCQLLHLTTANLLMSLYLITIMVFDVRYRNHFADITMLWRRMSFCKMAAAFNFIGSEVSLSLLLYISIYRAYSVHFVWQRLSRKCTRICCLIIWILWIVYVTVFTVLLGLFDIAVESNVCIFIFFEHKSHVGLILMHSIVFVTINCAMLVVPIFSYGFIAFSVCQAVGDTQISKCVLAKRRKSVSVRLALIVLFNTSCWSPLLVGNIMSLAGYQLDGSFSVWMALLIIPINSSFCPVMYCLIPAIFHNHKKRARAAHRNF